MASLGSQPTRHPLSKLPLSQYNLPTCPLPLATLSLEAIRSEVHMAQITDTTDLDNPGTKNSIAKMTWTASCMTPLESLPQRKQKDDNTTQGRPKTPRHPSRLRPARLRHLLCLGHMSRTSLHDEYNAYYSTFQWSFSTPRVPPQLNSVHHTLLRRSPCKNMTSKTNWTCWTWLLNNDERNDGLIPARSSSLCAVSTLQLNDFALNHTELRGLPNGGWVVRKLSPGTVICGTASHGHF